MEKLPDRRNAPGQPERGRASGVPDCIGPEPDTELQLHLRRAGRKARRPDVPQHHAPGIPYAGHIRRRRRQRAAQGRAVPGPGPLGIRRRPAQAGVRRRSPDLHGRDLHQHAVRPVRRHRRQDRPGDGLRHGHKGDAPDLETRPLHRVHQDDARPECVLDT